MKSCRTGRPIRGKHSKACFPFLQTTTMSNITDVDDSVSSLPPHILRVVDCAFDKAISESRSETPSERPRKRQRTLEDATPGGFVVDDEPPPPDGGFLVDESDDATAAGDVNVETHIPLSLIPRALQLLDLPPNDQEVLEVFTNAASGWEGQSVSVSGELGEQAVSRRDWRAVCAVLLPSSSRNEHVRAETDELSHSGLSSLSSLSSDEYDEDSGTEDDYKPTKKTGARNQAAKSAGTKSRKNKVTLSSAGVDIENSEDDHSLTARQKRDALSSFALFFPGTPTGPDGLPVEEALREKKLTAQDIASAARSIKEKISAEEVCNAIFPAV